MNLETILGKKLGLPHILKIRDACLHTSGDAMKSELFSLIRHPEDRTAYNALWVFTHFDYRDMGWLCSRRDSFIDLLLVTPHIGCRRLILTLLDRMPLGEQEFRTDYLDYCLAVINSSAPYAIRSLCLRQAYVQSCFYPELLAELMVEMELMQHGTMSPGLRCTRRNILKKIDCDVASCATH